MRPGWIASMIMLTVGISGESVSMPDSQDGGFLRVNMIAALCNQQLLAPFTVERACNRLVFETQACGVFGAPTQTGTSGGFRQCYLS